MSPQGLDESARSVKKLSDRQVYAPGRFNIASGSEASQNGGTLACFAAARNDNTAVRHPTSGRVDSDVDDAPGRRSRARRPVEFAHGQMDHLSFRVARVQDEYDPGSGG